MSLHVSCFSPNIQYWFWRSLEQQMYKNTKRVNALAKGGKRGTNHVQRPHERWVVTMNVCMPPPHICLIFTPSPPCSASVLCEFFSTLPITCKITSTAKGVYFVPWYSCVYPFLAPFLSSLTLQRLSTLASHSARSHTHTHTRRYHCNGNSPRGREQSGCR